MKLLDLITTTAHAADGSMSFWERMQPPEDISTYGHKIDWLFNYITIMDTLFFILVCIG